MTDILRNHGLTQSIGAHQHEIAGFGQKVQSQRTFDDIAFDFGGPGPFEIGYGLELLE
jgi:hypothetical protein